MADLPYLPLWTDAYLADTTDLSAEEHGVYLLLMMAAWRSPDLTLPDDDKRLARMAKVGAKKWRSLRPTMERFWIVENGMWWQKRLMKERDRVTRDRNQKSKAGKSGNEKRWAHKREGFRSASNRNATLDSDKSHSGTDKTLSNKDSGIAARSSRDSRRDRIQIQTPSPYGDASSSTTQEDDKTQCYQAARAFLTDSDPGPLVTKLLRVMQPSDALATIESARRKQEPWPYLWQVYRRRAEKQQQKKKQQSVGDKAYAAIYGVDE